ncbi:hypothetical protein [Massilia consociata]|uniref:PEGA domain-containing protein n=1 Tax=Massilia consociata TaxID=760117 RepID=A0ABV6FA03_9BURK
MTSTPVTQQQQTDGRTVREVVEFNQELVNEVWCRRIFRQLLQSLELQYAMQMPHRPINPDTILVLDSGDPMLLPSPDVGAAWSEAGDLHDLAAVVHYAITKETPPAAPLRGRALPEYSETFVNAVDRCLSPDPEQRPRTIEQLRNLLGIVPLGPAVPLQAAGTGTGGAPGTAAMPAPDPEPSFLDAPAAATEKGRLQRWLMLIAAATVLLGGLGALAALLHQADSSDALTLSLPGDEAPARQAPAAAGAGAPSGMDTAALATPEPAYPAYPATDDLAEEAIPAGAPPTAITIPPAHGEGAQHRQAAAAGATYKLVIKPWGAIQVNGVERGISPPLKRLTLPPGEHTIRIANPNFPEHTVTVNAVKGGSSVIELDFTEEDIE